VPRRLIPFLLLLAPATSRAQDADPVPDPVSPEPMHGAEPLPGVPEPVPEVGESPGVDVADREIDAQVGAAIGGGLTPGGLQIGGAYLYQLSDLDWFDGGVAFTFGSGAPTCFRDRADDLQCDHGVTDGVATDVRLGVRRFFAGRPGFRPWVRPSVGARLVYFSGDSLTGFGLFAAAAGGIRARFNDTMAAGVFVEVETGAALFGRGLGGSLQLGATVGVTCDFALP
jgi:hypothetical protein